MTQRDGREKRGDKTARDLLKAARSLFAKNGFDGTSLRDIAKDAGVNVGLVSYHFGSKEGLYLDVIDEALNDAVSAVKEGISQLKDGDFVQRACLGVDAYFDYIEKFPELPRLIQRAFLDGDTRIVTVARDYVGPAIASLRNPGDTEMTEIEHAGISVFGAMVVPALYAPLFKDLLDIDLLAPEQLKARREHIKRVVRAFLQADFDND